MRTCALTVAILTSLATAAPAQEAALDWSIYRQSDGNTVFAYIELSSGLTIAFRCVGGTFGAVVSGLPPVARGETVRTLNLRFRDQPAQDTRWTVASNPSVALADFPAAMARTLRQGGAFSLMVPGGGANGGNLRYNMTLPASAAAVDEVLTTCDRPLADPRDAMMAGVEADQLPGGVTWARAPRPTFPRSLYAEGYAVISCLVQPDGRVDDCEVESEFPPDGGFGRASLAAMRAARIASPNEAAGAYVPRMIGFRANYRMQ